MAPWKLPKFPFTYLIHGNSDKINLTVFRQHTMLTLIQSRVVFCSRDKNSGASCYSDHVNITLTKPVFDHAAILYLVWHLSDYFSLYGIAANVFRITSRPLISTTCWCLIQMSDTSRVSIWYSYVRMSQICLLRQCYYEQCTLNISHGRAALR